MQNHINKGCDNSWSSGDDSAPIVLPLLSLPSVPAPPMVQDQKDTPDDVPDPSPIVLPLKAPKASKANRRRVRKRRRLHLEMEEFSSRQAAILLQEETARMEEHQEQLKWQEKSVPTAEDEWEDIAQQGRDHDRAQVNRQ